MYDLSAPLNPEPKLAIDISKSFVDSEVEDLVKLDKISILVHGTAPLFEPKMFFGPSSCCVLQGTYV